MMPRGGGDPTATSFPARAGFATMAEEANIASTSPKTIWRGQRGVTIRADGVWLIAYSQSGEQSTWRIAYSLWSDIPTSCHKPYALLVCRQLPQLSSAGPALVVAWPDGAPLALIDPAAPQAAPGIFGQCANRVVKVVADRDVQAVAIHRRHFFAKVRAVVRPFLENIELPLVDHLVRQRAEYFLVRLLLQRQSDQEILSTLAQRQREPDEPAARWWVRAAGRSRPRSDPADEHAGRGGQARAPLNVDGGESSP